MATRYALLARHENRCQGCGGLFLDNELIVDHIQPLAEGGSNDETNLQLLCRDGCHRVKTAAEAQRGRCKDGRGGSNEAMTSPGNR